MHEISIISNEVKSIFPMNKLLLQNIDFSQFTFKYEFLESMLCHGVVRV